MTRKLREAREEGFTLIELLVVVIIIGILAAIAIPAFLSVRGNAGDATAESDLRNAVIHMESYYTSNGNYNVGNDAAAVTVLTGAGWEVSGDSTVDEFNTTDTTFCIQITSSESSNTWAVSNNEDIDGDGTPGDNEPVQGTCA